MVMAKLRLFRCQRDGIFSLPSFNQTFVLEELSAWNNQLSVFPNLTASALTIRKINIGSNGITYIPAELLDPLIALEELYISEMALGDLPDVPGPGNTLLILDISHNNFQKMPNLNQLGRSLQELYVQGNSYLTGHVGPAQIGALQKLQMLNLGGTNITSLADVTQNINLVNVWYDQLVNAVPVMPKDVINHKTLALLSLEFTDIANPLPTMCSVNLTATLELHGNGEHLCACDYAWVILARDEGLTVVSSNVTCMGMLWSELDIAAFMEVCQWASDSWQLKNECASKCLFA